MIRRLVLFASVMALTVPLCAETKLYTLQIPESKPASFRLELPVEHAGTLMLRLEWPIDRLIALRLEAPGAWYPPYKRSGPSPLFMEVKVEPRQLGSGPWKLSIHAEPAREGCEALMTVEFPEPPGAESAPSLLEQSAPPPPPPPDPWMVSRAVPPGSPEAWRQLYESIETYRGLLDMPDDEQPVDSCRWQDDLMRYLAARRDELAGSGAMPVEVTRAVLLEIADAIRSVEGMRLSRDPVVAGPRPDDPGRRRSWLAYRKERFQPLEQELDDLLQTLRRNRAPALGEEPWPVRMVSCLTACERYFEERVRKGERQATNREIALAQWDRMLAAAEALEALGAIK
jgi:hypothetical protein